MIAKHGLFAISKSKSAVYTVFLLLHICFLCHWTYLHEHEVLSSRSNICVYLKLCLHWKYMVWVSDELGFAKVFPWLFCCWKQTLIFIGSLLALSPALLCCQVQKEKNCNFFAIKNNLINLGFSTHSYLKSSGKKGGF